MVPKGNVVASNICWGGGRWDEIEESILHHVLIKDNLVDTDPLFVDPKNRDFTLKSNSSAFKLGFKPIDVKKIGLKKKK